MMGQHQGNIACSEGYLLTELTVQVSVEVQCVLTQHHLQTGKIMFPIHITQHQR